MATKVIKILSTTFKVRRGQSSVFARNNPILQAGEPGFELDTYKLKIGDGVTDWNNLPYINGEESNDIPISMEQIQGLF